MTAEHLIAEKKLTLNGIRDILAGNMKLVLTKDIQAGIKKCQDFLEAKAQNPDQPIYGINTGFGALYNKTIAREDQQQLQVNLVTSHASGVGPEVPQEIVRIMLLLKIQSLAFTGIPGYS